MESSLASWSILRHEELCCLTRENPGFMVCYESLKQVYAEIVKEDPSSMVFGPPEDFYRILKPNDYENEVNTSEVVWGYPDYRALA